jgi:hypothetical protein
MDRWPASPGFEPRIGMPGKPSPAKLDGISSSTASNSQKAVASCCGVGVGVGVGVGGGASSSIAS